MNHWIVDSLLAYGFREVEGDIMGGVLSTLGLPREFAWTPETLREESVLRPSWWLLSPDCLPEALARQISADVLLASRMTDRFPSSTMPVAAEIATLADTAMRWPQSLIELAPTDRIERLALMRRSAGRFPGLLPLLADSHAQEIAAWSTGGALRRRLKDQASWNEPPTHLEPDLVDQVGALLGEAQVEDIEQRELLVRFAEPGAILVPPSAANSDQQEILEAALIATVSGDVGAQEVDLGSLPDLQAGETVVVPEIPLPSEAYGRPALVVRGFDALVTGNPSLAVEALRQLLCLTWGHDPATKESCPATTVVFLGLKDPLLRRLLHRATSVPDPKNHPAASGQED